MFVYLIVYCFVSCWPSHRKNEEEKKIAFKILRRLKEQVMSGPYCLSYANYYNTSILFHIHPRWLATTGWKVALVQPFTF